MKALILILLLLLTGCAAQPTIYYRIDDPVNICLMDAERIIDNSGYDAYAYPRTRTVFVPYTLDRQGRPTPDFYLLGHEIWHMPELGYLYHE